MLDVQGELAAITSHPSFGVWQHHQKKKYFVIKMWGIKYYIKGQIEKISVVYACNTSKDKTCECIMYRHNLTKTIWNQNMSLFLNRVSSLDNLHYSYNTW